MKNGLSTESTSKFWGKIVPFFLFLITFWIYFGVGTDWNFQPRWDLDFYNPLAQSFLQGRLDIPSPATTYDLSFYGGKYYPYWGVLPALFLIPLQILMGRFVPTFYLSLLFGSFNVLALYFLLSQVKKEFFPKFSSLQILAVTLFFAFGTMHFYLATLSGVWHVVQVISFLPAVLGLMKIFKKKRTVGDYFWSSFFFSLNFFGRLSMVGFLTLPVLFWFGEKKTKKRWAILRALAIPFLLFFLCFCLYNYSRFGNPLEAGYRYALYHPHFEKIIQKNGIFSLKNIPRNLWFMVFETPALSWDDGVKLRFSLEGSSIFFLAPPLLSIFLAFPWKKKPYVISLWLTLLVVMVPVLIIYSTGWIQFGYRYSLDFLALLILLSVFGMKGGINFLYCLGIVFSVWMQILGISTLR